MHSCTCSHTCIIHAEIIVTGTTCIIHVVLVTMISAVYASKYSKNGQQIKMNNYNVNYQYQSITYNSSLNVTNRYYTCVKNVKEITVVAILRGRQLMSDLQRMLASCANKWQC